MCHEYYNITRIICKEVVRNYIRDGRRSSEAVFQEKASNHSKLRWSKARVVSVKGKGGT